MALLPFVIIAFETRRGGRASKTKGFHILSGLLGRAGQSDLIGQGKDWIFKT